MCFLADESSMCFPDLKCFRGALPSSRSLTQSLVCWVIIIMTGQKRTVFLFIRIRTVETTSS